MTSETASAMGAKPKLWTPTFIFVLLLTLCCFICGQGLNSGTTVYLAAVGGTATYAGTLALVFSASAAVTRIVCGGLIDAKGRAIVFTLGAVLLVVGTFSAALVPIDLPLAVCRVLQGAGFSAATTSAATAAADVLPRERLGEGIGYYGLGQAIAMSIGPALAITLVGTENPANLYFGIAVVAGIAFLIALLIRYEKKPQILPETSAYRTRWEEGRAAGHSEAGAQKTEPKGSFASRIFEPGALCGAIPMLIMCPAFGFGIFFMGLYGTSLGVGSAGLFYTVSAVSMIAVRLLSGRFMDTVAPIKILAFAAVFGLVAYAMQLGAGAGFGLLYYCAGIPYGISLGLSLPVCQSVAVKNSPAERWGAANGLFLLMNDVGIGCSSLLWGAINDSVGFAGSLVGVMICIVVSYVVALFMFPGARSKKK